MSNHDTVLARDYTFSTLLSFWQRRWRENNVFNRCMRTGFRTVGAHINVQFKVIVFFSLIANVTVVVANRSGRAFSESRREGKVQVQVSICPTPAFPWERYSEIPCGPSSQFNSILDVLHAVNVTMSACTRIWRQPLRSIASAHWLRECFFFIHYLNNHDTCSNRFCIFFASIWRRSAETHQSEH